MFYLTTHSTHFIYGYMASDIWLRTILIVRKETRCCHIGYSYRLTARVLLYAPSHGQDNTYHGLCYTSRGALAGTRIHQHLFSGQYVGAEGGGGKFSDLTPVSDDISWWHFLITMADKWKCQDHETDEDEEPATKIKIREKNIPSTFSARVCN